MSSAFDPFVSSRGQTLYRAFTGKNHPIDDCRYSLTLSAGHTAANERGMKLLAFLLRRWGASDCGGRVTIHCPCLRTEV
jgi:hypothetical protein